MNEKKIILLPQRRHSNYLLPRGEHLKMTIPLYPPIGSTSAVFRTKLRLFWVRVSDEYHVFLMPIFSLEYSYIYLLHGLVIAAGPLVEFGSIRVGVHRARWSTFTAEPFWELDIDVAIIMNNNVTTTQRVIVEMALNKLSEVGFVVN